MTCLEHCHTSLRIATSMLLVKLLGFITVSYQSASAAFASPSELFFPSHLPPIVFMSLDPAPHLTHLFHSPPLLIPQLPSPSPSPPPVRLVTISSPAPSSILETWHSIPTHPRTHQNLIPTSEARAKTRCHDTLTRRDTRYESIG